MGSRAEIILVRAGTVRSHIALAQSSAPMDWSKLEPAAFVTKASKAAGQICLPVDNELREIAVTKSGPA